MAETLRIIVDEMEHEKAGHVYYRDGYVEKVCLPECPKCRLLAVLTEAEKVDLVQRLRMFAERSENADWSDGINRAADELTEWLAARGIGAKQ